MKKYCLLLFVLYSQILCSKNVIDSVNYRFVYDVQAKKYEKSNRLFTDEHYLDIGYSGVSMYYSRWYERGFQIIEEVMRNGGSMHDVRRIKDEEGVEPSDFEYYILKNYPQASQQTVDCYSLEIFQYQEPMGQAWELAEGDTIVLDHTCHKAVCRYHGKEWTAYYTTDIPIADGPWKLCGLPGLIMRAYDGAHEFIFNCIGIQQNVGDKLFMREGKRHIMKPKEAQRLVEQIDENPDSYYEAKEGAIGEMRIYDDKGKEMKNITLPKRVYYESYSSEE